jgi:hypothetical protein
VRSFIRSVCFGTALLAVSAHAQTELPPGTWSVSNAPAELRDAISRADVVLKSMDEKMMRELTAALGAGGAGRAMEACHADVDEAAYRVARAEGIAAGRTSDRLRRPTNAPRPWAAPLVKAYAGKPAKDVEGFVVDLGETVGVIRPMAQRPMCAACHGPADKFSPAVRAALKDRFPADRGTGFKEGEIRGWFWVEIPKTR